MPDSSAPSSGSLLAGWWPGVYLAIVVLLVFAPALLDGRMLAPIDGLAQNFPHRVLVAEALKHGEMPFWNPFFFGGMPLLAAVQPGVFFPGNWTFLILPPFWAMNVSVLLAYWVAGMGTYALSRSLDVSRAGALVAAVGFMVGGFMALHVEHLNMIQAAGLLPWLLWLIKRYIDTGARRVAGLLALLVAISIFAGHPQMTAYSLLVAGAFSLWQLLQVGPDRRPGLALGLAAMGALGIGLAALQLLPTLEFIPESQRQTISFERLTRHSMAVLGFPLLVSPYLFGVLSPSGWLDTPFWVDWATAGRALEGYIGVGGLMLAVVAGMRLGVDRRVQFFGGVAILAFLLALGRNTPLYHLIAATPVLKSMPYASRHLMEFTLAMSMLAGIGLSTLEAGGGVTRRMLLIGVSAVLLPLVGVLTWIGLKGSEFAARTQPLLPPYPGLDLARALSLEEPGVWIPVALLAATALLLAWGRGSWRLYACGVLLALDLGVFGAHQAWRSPQVPSKVTFKPAAVETRVLAVPAHPWFHPYYSRVTGPAPYSEIQALQVPGVSAISGIRTVNGHDAFVPRRFGQLMGMESRGDVASWNDHIWKPEHHGLDILAMREARIEPAMAETSRWQERLATSRWRPLPEEAGLVRAENMRAMPRAWRVETVTRLEPAGVDRRVSSDAAFEPRREALVETEVSQATWSSGTADAQAEGFNAIRVTTSGGGPGFVVVSEGYDPGWRAYLGDREVPVVRVDALVMGLAVPAGAQTVTLRYEPRLWRMGLATTVLSAVVLGLGLWLWPRRRRNGTLL